MAAKQYGCGSLVAVLLFAGVTVPLVNGLLRRDAGRPFRDEPAPPAPARPAPTQTGDEAILGAPGLTGVSIALDDEAWNRMTDVEEIERLMAAGRVVREPVGTRVKVVGMSVFARKVRVRAGGEHPGVEGWVATEFVQPFR